MSERGRDRQPYEPELTCPDMPDLEPEQHQWLLTELVRCPHCGMTEQELLKAQLDA